MISFKVYRILHPDGWVEFKDSAEATNYRDVHHVGCEIVILDREIVEDSQEEQPVTNL